MYHGKFPKSNKRFYLLIVFILLLFFSLYFCRQTANSNSESNEQSGTVLDVMTFNIPGDRPGSGMMGEGMLRGGMIGGQGGGFDRDQGGTRSSWEERFPIVCDILRNYDIDFVGFQEITRRQLDQIREVLPQYGELGVARDDGQTRGEYCAILYRADRFKMSEDESGTFWLSETPEVPGSRSWNTSYIRICTWARFTEINSGNSFYFYNTHLDVDSQWAREEGALLILDRIKRRTYQEPYFLAGDFNANEQEQTITYIKGITPLTGQNGEQVTNTIPMVDTFRVLYPDQKDVRTRHDWTYNKEGDKIDYVFASPDIKIIKAEIVYYNKNGKYPSDHYPVMATISIPAKK